jgi:hypothetical protein
MILSEDDGILYFTRTGVRVVIDFEGRDAAGEGGDDPGNHGTSEPARVRSRGLNGPLRPGAHPDL